MEEIKIKKRREENWIYYTECPYCKKHMEQNYETQLRHNMTIHMINCEANPENQTKIKQTKK